MVAPPMAPPMAPPPMAPMSAPAPRPDYSPNYPPGYGPGYAPGYGQGYQPPVAAAPLTVPPPAPEQQSPMYRPSAQPAPGNMAFRDIPGMPNMAPDSASLADEASKGDQDFSATELGLPRLTYADLGKGLSAGIAQEMESQTHGETRRALGRAGLRRVADLYRDTWRRAYSVPRRDERERGVVGGVPDRRVGLL